MKRETISISSPEAGRHLLLQPLALYVATGMILIVLPYFLPLQLQSMVTKVIIFGIFAMSLDLIWGYTGLISFGHAAYFGLAGYVTGILILRYGVTSFWLVMPAAIVVSAFAASIFGLLALRARGMYFFFITFAFGELLFNIAWRWRGLTGGSDGLPGIPPPDLGLPWLNWGAASFYYFVLAVFGICFFFLYRFTHSPFGHALVGIRENEPRMRALGYNTWAHKYVAFILGAVFAGVAGVLHVHFTGIAYPASLGFTTSALVLLMVVIGGAGTLVGPLMGAVIMVLLKYYVSIYTPERWPLILGVIFIMSAMLFRGGLLPRLVKLRKEVRKLAWTP